MGVWDLLTRTERTVKRSRWAFLCCSESLCLCFPETVVYNTGACSLMFAQSCLASVTTALLTSQGCR